jgi:ribosomal-protein-alanine N-acetyltransferase
MPIEIHVSAAGPYDPPSMTAIHRECFVNAWNEATMAQFLASSNVLCLIGSVADDSGGVVGGLLIARKAADEAELLTLGVAPACRHTGLGRALLEAAIAALRDSGAKCLFLEVEEGNAAALALYRSLGAKAAIFSLALSPSAADDV